MAKLQCEICGGGKLLKQGDVWVCRDCGSQYTAEDVRRMFQSAGGAPALAPEDPPTEVKAPKDETVTVAQAESETVRVQASDFTIVAGTLTRYNGSKLDVVIPDGVITIGERCFFGMSNLRSVIIPDSVKQINISAFEGCSGLKEITIPDGVEKVGACAFRDCKELTRIEVGKNTVLVFKAFDGCTGVTWIKSGIRNAGAIAKWAGTDCTIEIVEGETEIVDHAFEKCSELTSLTLPKTVKRIGESAFDHCGKLKEITIPDGVTTIGKSAFTYCRCLKKIVLPDSITTIGADAFSCCANLAEVVLPEGIRSIGELAFASTGLRKITIPSRVESIGVGAFSGCYDLMEVVLPDTLNELGRSAFRSCKKLSSINVPKSLKQLGDWAFVECIALPANAKAAFKKLNKKALKDNGCYVATCVYGSYDCPEVWTLRRYRDDTLGATWYGRLFIRFYYAVAPTLVKWFGESEWFRAFCRKRLDRKVAALAEQGVEDTPYEDKDWRK